MTLRLAVGAARQSTPRPRMAVHPGAVLKRELELRSLGLKDLAGGTGLSLDEIDAIIAGRSAVAAAIAVALGRFFGHSAKFWTALQGAYDERTARAAAGSRPDG